jgi:orotate phosphoribosyltransferase
MKLKKSILTHAFIGGGKAAGFSYRFDNRNFFLNASTEDLESAIGGIWKKIKHLNPELIFGKGIGSFPMLTALKLHAYHTDKVDLQVLFVRDQRKGYGTQKLIEGPLPEQVLGKRAIFVDDLMDYARTYKKTLQSLQEEDYELNIVGAISLIDFWRPTGSRTYNAQGFPMLSLFRRHELGVTRDERFLPKLLDKPHWRMHVFHNGVNIMPYKGAPVIYKDYLLIGNDNNSHYCFNKNTGDLIWKYDSARPQPKGDCSVSQIDGDLVYWTTYDGTVRCCDVHTGKLNWMTKLDLNLHSSPCLDRINKRMFIGTEWKKSSVEMGGFGLGDIVCLDYNGHEIWRYMTRGMIPCSPAYSEKHNIVCCGSNDFYVYLLNADTGELVKSVPVIGEVKGLPVFSLNQDVVIVATMAGWVYALETTTGNILWKRSVGSGTTHSYPCLYENFVVVSNDNDFCFCFNIKTGYVEWTRQFRAPLGWGVIDVGMCLLGVSTNGYVNLIDKYTGEKLTHDLITDHADIHGVEISQPPAYDGENLTIVTNNKGILSYKINIKEVLNATK